MAGTEGPLRLAIVGCGVIAETHALALKELPETAVRLAACCDIDGNLAEEFSRRFGVPARAFEALLGDGSIDAISFCTPSGIHAAQGVEALEAGKHVIVEKPMDVSVAACDRLLAAQAKSGRRLAVISQHRFDPASVAVRRALDRSELGDLFYAEAQIPWYRTQEYYDSGDWRGTWEMDGGGCLMNQGIHTVDLLRWFCGPVKRVQATMKTVAHERIEVEDFVSATLQFESGASGTLVASTAMYPGFPARIALYGTKGTAIIEGDALRTLAIRGGVVVESEAAAAHALQVAKGGTMAAKAGVRDGDRARSDSAWGDAHRAQYADFIECCRSGGEPLVNGEAGRAAVELVRAIYETARSGDG